MSQLWTPPNARTMPRAQVPTSDVALVIRTMFPSGTRTLRLITLARLSNFPPAPDPEILDGAVFQDVGGRDPNTISEREINGRSRGLRAIASMDDTAHGLLLHVSFSYPTRLPTWEEVKAVREAFYTDSIDVMMPLPRSGYWVNVHDFTFHLEQMPIGWGQR